jgi:hypothetical protein
VAANAWHWVCVAHVGKHCSTPLVVVRHAFGVPAVFEPQPALVAHTSLQKRRSVQSPEAQAAFVVH